MSHTIFLVEDNSHILDINREILRGAGYRVLMAATLAAARKVLAHETPDLLVLDVMLPDGDGVAFCAELRAQGLAAPVLFLTAKSGKSDILEGLTAGGDDYLTKPYDLDIFLARVQALLRRAVPAPVPQGGTAPARTLCVGNIEINFLARRVLLGGRDALLTPKEYALLELLIKNRGRYIPTATLYESVWGMDALKRNGTVREHIYRLRRKLGEGAALRVEGLRGQGYRVV